MTDVRARTIRELDARVAKLSFATSCARRRPLPLRSVARLDFGVASLGCQGCVGRGRRGRAGRLGGRRRLPWPTHSDRPVSNPSQIARRLAGRIEELYGLGADLAADPDILAHRSDSSQIATRQEGSSVRRELTSSASRTKGWAAVLGTPTRSWRPGTAGIRLLSAAQLEEFRSDFEEWMRVDHLARG